MVCQMFFTCYLFRHRYLATGFLEKCDRTVFEIVSPTDDLEKIKNGITLVAGLLQ